MDEAEIVAQGGENDVGGNGSGWKPRASELRQLKLSADLLVLIFN
jgi:hypothetical protein